MTTLDSSGLGSVLAPRSLAVVAGGGGVGKTTVSAALALAAGRRLDGDVLVLTIDPARRLASALGIDIDGNSAVEIPTQRTKLQSKVFAAMLDPGRAWDAMVEAQATPETAAKILANPVYRRIADTFVHGNDYAALGWLDEAIASDRYQLIIVDTPPSQNALDFFDAPGRVEEFFGSSLLSWLTGGDGSLVATAAARTFASLADKLLGAQFFADVVEFFQLMRDVGPGMVERTRAVAEQLAGEQAAFIAVTAPTVDAQRRLERLAASLDARDLSFDAVVVNGVEPDPFWNARVCDVARRVATDDRSPFNKSSTVLLRPGADYVLERSRVADVQAVVIDSIQASTVAALPRLVHSPTDVAGLLALGELLWSGGEGSS